MFVVLHDFTDMQDGHVYHAGDIFPRDGMTVEPERLAVLQSFSNRQGKPLIQRAINYPLKEEKPEIEPIRALQGDSGGKEPVVRKRRRRKTE